MDAATAFEEVKATVRGRMRAMGRVDVRGVLFVVLGPLEGVANTSNDYTKKLQGDKTSALVVEG